MVSFAFEDAQSKSNDELFRGARISEERPKMWVFVFASLRATQRERGARLALLWRVFKCLSKLDGLAFYLPPMLLARCPCGSQRIVVRGRKLVPRATIIHPGG